LNELLPEDVDSGSKVVYTNFRTKRKDLKAEKPRRTGTHRASRSLAHQDVKAFGDVLVRD
jgi:hypothetical protein